MAEESAPKGSSLFDRMNNEEFVGWCYRVILGRPEDPAGRDHYVSVLAQGTPRLALMAMFLQSPEYQTRRPEVKFPAGHFYSPIPSAEEIDRHQAFNWQPEAIPGVDLRPAAQLELLERLRGYYDACPFPTPRTPGRRYYYDNAMYGHADAIFLYGMMRELKPKRIIEVGCGHSSCAILDTNELFFGGQIECVFIEPHPAALRNLLGAEADRLTLRSERLQDVPLSVFDSLAQNDILFVDSSHVGKLNSDVLRLFFDILPRLKAGVAIHIHDVFYPFEYPQAWLREGRAWNEQYLLRAFLQYNTAFRITLFTNYVLRQHNEWFRKHMPDCLKNTGGSLWMEKVSPA